MTVTRNVDRRGFLQGTSGVLTGLLAVGSPFALLAPSRAWAMDLAALTTAEGRQLLIMLRTIAPHDGLDDAAYALVVQTVDADAAKDSAARAAIRAGIATLGADFATAGEGARVAQLKIIERGQFFQDMRQRTLQVLYATPMAYALFGYEGEAFSKGGYLTRGFDDLRWLPEVPEQDGGRI
ncbi:MAG: twin-arginine translocation signal domain-containing protein [Pseudomonadota bacterium]